MPTIITYLIDIIQYQNQQIRWLLLFISKYIPLGQWAHDDAHSPKYQKFKTDILPNLVPFIKKDWLFLLPYFEWKYGKKSALFSVATVNLSQRILFALVVVHLTITFMTTMETRVSFNAKYVIKLLLLVSRLPKT